MFGKQSKTRLPFTETRFGYKILVLLILLVLIFRLIPIISQKPAETASKNEQNRIQKALEDKLLSFLPSPEGELLAGVVLGSKKSLPQSFYNQLRQTGTIHIVVASGMNVVMLAGSIFDFLVIWFKRKVALIPLFVLIWFYAFLTGFEAPIVRASIMLSLVFLAQEFGRPTDAARILAISGLTMILIDPVLVFSLSFQLSFASTAGLVFVLPVIKKSKAFKGIFRSEDFSSTLAAQIATLPIIIGNFGEYNLASPLINFLVLWTIPIILKFGLVITTLRFIRPVGLLLSYLVYPLLRYFVLVVSFFSGIKIFQVWTPKTGFWWGVGYYLVLGYWIIGQKNRFEKGRS